MQTENTERSHVSGPSAVERRVGRHSLEILEKLGNAMTGYTHICGLETLDALLAEAAQTIELLCSWEADAQARAGLLEQHLRAVLEVARTWQPDYATQMDRDTLQYAQDCADGKVPNAKATCPSVPLETLVGRLIEMHNNPPRKIGWMEQTTLREAAEMLTRLANDARPAGLYVGKVQYVRAGGNAGLAWYVAPDYESCEYGYQPNDGDRLYAVTPNAIAQGREHSERPAGAEG